MVDRRAPSPVTSNKKAICEPVPSNLFDDATKPASPMRLQSPDRADAPAFVFADAELCVERQPMKQHVRGGGTGSERGSPAAAGGSPTGGSRRLLDKCRFSPASERAQPPIPPECLRFSAAKCKPEPTECPPLYDEFTQPPTETCEEYLTKPMRLPPLRTDLDFVYDTENTLFAI